MPFVVAIAGVLLLDGSHARAHDLWLIPSDGASKGKAVVVRANVGTQFPKSIHAPDASAFVRRTLMNPDGSAGQLEAAGKEGTSGLLQFQPTGSGTYLIGVETKPRLLTLDADAFNLYLVSDSLPHIYRLRAREKSLAEAGKERYRKSPTALIRIGRGGGGDPCRPLDLPLQIVPLRDPFTLKTGDTLRVRVLFRGKPLPGANLGWQLPGDGDLPRGTVRSDSAGEALIPVAGPGLMSVRLTHMTRPKAAEYEWESFWTTLTFRLSGPQAGNTVQHFRFHNKDLGKLPSGWQSAKTGMGDGGIWKVQKDDSAPSKTGYVLAQTAAGPRRLFNLCVKDKIALRDLEISVAFKAVRGDEDQGGGLVWRYQDADNYYIARMNPLESNYRLYRVVQGKRIQLATKEDVKIPAGEWHDLKVKHIGDRIECHLDGKKYLEARDAAFTRAGRVGLWTKADAQTWFDTVVVIELGLRK